MFVSYRIDMYKVQLKPGKNKCFNRWLLWIMSMSLYIKQGCILNSKIKFPPPRPTFKSLIFFPSFSLYFISFFPGGIWEEYTPLILKQPLPFSFYIFVKRRYAYFQIQILSTLGGSDVGDIVRKMMCRLMTNNLMSQYTLKEKSGKASFDKIVLYRLLISKLL